MNRWDWFMLGTVALVPLAAFLDTMVLHGSTALYGHYLILSYLEAFCLVVGYVIGKGVKHP